MMNRTTSQRAEEARRQAQAAALKTKQAESTMIKERAAAMAVEAQKVGNLRALRLAKEASAKEAADAEALSKALAPKPPRKRTARSAPKIAPMSGFGPSAAQATESEA